MQAGMLVELRKEAIPEYQSRFSRRWMVGQQLTVDTVDSDMIGFHNEDNCEHGDCCDLDGCDFIDWYYEEDFKQVLMFKDRGIKRLNLPEWF